MSRVEITEKVSEVLVDALGADEDEISLEATLMGDLDAESIDFLDIVFQLEKTFDLKIPRAELFPGPQDIGDEIHKLSTATSDQQLSEFVKDPIARRDGKSDSQMTETPRCRGG